MPGAIARESHVCEAGEPNLGWGMEVLLPYLVGAASTFVVQFLIQAYVVPRVQTRKQNHERWLEAVLDLGELVTVSLRRSATEAWEKQYSYRVLKEHETDPDFDPATVRRGLWERKLAGRQATQELNDLVHFRVNWVVDRIIALSGESDQAFEFFSIAYRYRVKHIQLAPSQWEELSQEEFDAFWDSERGLRIELTSVVKKLSCLTRPPRATWRRRFQKLRRRLAKFSKVLWSKSTSLLRTLSHKALSPVSKFWLKSTKPFRKPAPPATQPQQDASFLPSS